MCEGEGDKDRDIELFDTKVLWHYFAEPNFKAKRVKKKQQEGQKDSAEGRERDSFSSCFFMSNCEVLIKVPACGAYQITLTKKFN